MKISQLIILVLAFALSNVLTSCGQQTKKSGNWHTGEVEVSPDLFMEVEENSASSDDGVSISFTKLHVFGSGNKAFNEVFELRMRWQGTTVHWKGNSGPLNLRAHDGKLHLITFDRVTKGVNDCFFRYYTQAGSELKEVRPADFPKSVAGQNVDFSHRYFSCGDKRRDYVQIARDLDPADACFRSSLTAYIWAELATGQGYEESLKKWAISEGLLQAYIRTNQPVKLKTMIREAKPQGDKPDR